MTIKEILVNAVSLSGCRIEVNGELYDESKHGDLIHIDTEIETYEEYNNFLRISFWGSRVKLTAISKDKILKLLKDKDADNSLSDYIDKRIKKISEE